MRTLNFGMTTITLGYSSKRSTLALTGLFVGYLAQPTNRTPSCKTESERILELSRPRPESGSLSA
jgi:hypothetical protein